MYEKEIQEILKNLLKGKGASGLNIDINIEKLITLALKQMSVGYDSALYMAGYRSGESFVKGVDIKEAGKLKENIETLFLKSGMGEAVVSGESPMTLVVKKSSTCYGTRSAEKPVCYFKAGFFAGAVSAVQGKKVPCVETKCHAKGDEHCEFLINVQ